MTVSEFKTTFKDLSSIDLEVFLLTVLNCTKSELFLNQNLVLTKKQLKLLHSYVKRRQQNEPVAYIVNNKEFFGLDFFVNKSVLIPRPETEEMLEFALKINPKPTTILDIGTGSGCIAITLASHLPKAKITALDICKRALNIAIKNSNLHQTSNITFLQSDLLKNIPENSHFDLIITNPPYICQSEASEMSAETLQFEPKKALFADNNGLSIYQRLLKQLKLKNISFNHFLGEFGFQQENLIRDLLEIEFYGKYTLQKDLAGITRFVHINNKK